MIVRRMVFQDVTSMVPEMELLRVGGIAPLLGTPKDKFEEIVQLVITWNV